ncbi:MAG: hypothetical protein HKL85_11475 [Acidimicrobiaceae bacterium]|nr:hypothetical protein [Acidimicrobiaceae bacterium]
MTFSIDKSDWRKVRFGDVVSNVNEVVRDPSALDIERSVGLEHLDPGELAVTRWAAIEEGTSFTRRVQSGQTLFGKRRSYQRKTAYATFNAICSGDILVFYPKDPQVLLPELLPFIASSDAFYNVALRTSAGSLSPRTRWSDLAAFEFLLPSLAEQQRIADLLWAFEQHRQSVRAVELRFSTAEMAWTERAVWDNPYPEQALSDLLDSCNYGLSDRCVTDQGDGCPAVLRIPNVVQGHCSFHDLRFLPEAADSSHPAAIREGDFLVVRTNGNPSYVGIGALVEQMQETTLFASYLLRLRTMTDRLLPSFLALCWGTKKFNQRLRPYVRSSAGNYNLSSSSILGLSIPCPPLTEQLRVVAEFDKFTGARREIAANERALKESATVVLEALLGGRS